MRKQLKCLQQSILRTGFYNRYLFCQKIKCSYMASNFILISIQNLIQAQLMMRKHLNTSSSFSRKKELIKTTKPSFLKQHSDKIEIKLASLKSMIREKKETSRIYKEKEKNIDPKISKFLSKIGMNAYLPKFLENGVQNFDLFQQIKQKQLQQIGIPKGHALKIVINLKREHEDHEKTVNFMKKSDEHHSKKTESTLTKQPQQSFQRQINSKKVVAETFIQTQSSFLQNDNPKKYFCLFCYMKAQKDFCSERCKQSYDRMFRKYQDNLVRAQNMFGQKQVQKIDNNQQSQDEEYDDGRDFMSFINQQFSDKARKGLDEQKYQEIKEKIKLLKKDQQQSNAFES